ncbi:magnesium transporter CorA family protein [Aureimonas mangrovi]|uniref:magnesium transporter CorA family protein n=1 Tax=Aureimonas mangrovi TaxID=2758041 RepID=UPI00163D4E04|nr:magnesium transporter CorA family protein [Aureimonas mangrovi]
MLTAYHYADSRLIAAPQGTLPEESAATVWIDLLDPTREEELAVESRFGIEVPTEAEMQEIELSSRLYEEDGALFMTIMSLFRLDEDPPQKTLVTFVLKDRLLVTVRRARPRPFDTFLTRAAKPRATHCETGVQVMLGLFETIVDRLADGLESAANSVDTLSREVFRKRRGREKAQGRDLESLIGVIGRNGELVALIQESMVSLSRAASFLSAIEPEQGKGPRDGRKRLKMIQRDLDSLSEYAMSLVDKVTFLLDATLGLISIEQNKIMKIFSIVAVVFMPTLVASTYGMNFERMPELSWAFGYPYALILMLLFAILPFAFFKAKGWL